MDQIDVAATRTASSRGLRRKGWAAAGAILAGGTGITLTTATPALASGTQAPVPDPDVVHWTSGVDYMFGTTVSSGSCAPNPPGQTLLVPWLQAPTNSTFDGVCASGDAFAPPSGWWGDPAGGIWAPSVVNFNGQWHMYYTAQVRGTGQRCIGHALLNTGTGKFVPNDGNKWACPGGGKWALDPDAKVIDGRIVVTYRDDNVAPAPVNGVRQTAISIVATDANGWANWSTRRTAFTSAQLGYWATNNANTDKIVENPNLVPRGDGSWDLFVSSGEWNSPNYGTAIAHCGGVFDAGNCKLMGSTDSPYFGYSGNAFGTQFTLPEDHPGPGGMDAYKNSSDAGWRVAWHWWKSEGTRLSMTAPLSWNGSVWKVG